MPKTSLPIWEKLGLIESEWKEIPAEDRQKLKLQKWQSKPCVSCKKPVMVSSKKAKPYCMECFIKEEK